MSRQLQRRRSAQQEITGFSMDCSDAVASLTAYLQAHGGQVLSTRTDGGNNYPVICYRTPNSPTTQTYVVNPNKSNEQRLKEVAGNIGIKFTPKWREQAAAKHVM